MLGGVFVLVGDDVAVPGAADGVRVLVAVSVRVAVGVPVAGMVPVAVSVTVAETDGVAVG